MTVDWHAVQDGLGSAGPVPGLIEALGAGKKAQREAAYATLSEERLVHQGTVWPAAPLSVPLLAEALRAPKHPGRALVLALLATIAVGVPVAYLRGAAGRDALAAMAVAEGTEGDAYRAVRNLRADIAERLGDRSADVRAHAAAALALVDPGLAAPRLVAHLATEQDAPARAAIWAFVGLAARLGSSSVEVPPAPAGAPPEELAARALALAIAGGKLDGAALARALEPPLADVEIPLGRISDLALGVAAIHGDAGRNVLASVLAAATMPRNVLLASAIVQSVFPGSRQGPTDAPLVSSSTLSASQLGAIRLVASIATEPLWPPLAYLPSVGLTRWLPDLKRFVGLDPPGPLERRVAWRRSEVEAIVVLDALTRGAAEENEARAALVAGAGPEELAGLALAASGNAYLKLHSRADWTMGRAIAFACSLLPGPSVVPHLLGRLARGEVVGYATWVLVDALARYGTAEIAAMIAWEPLLMQAVQIMRGDYFADIARRGLALAPEATRDAVVRSVLLVDRVERAPRIRGVLVEPAVGGWALIDLATDREDAAERAVAAVAGWTAIDDATYARPVEAAQRAIAALRPESRRALEAALPSATRYGRTILEPLLRPD